MHAWRSEQLRRLGPTRLCAERITDRVDWHELAELLERGCSVELAPRSSARRMYARAVDDAATRLRSLHREKREDFSLAALAVALAGVAASLDSEFALPLLVGGLAMGGLGLRAVFHRWDLVEQLSGERDAYVLPEVLACARYEAAIERRRALAAMIRSHLPQPGVVTRPAVAAAADELEALARELDDRRLALDPAAAVACLRLVTGIDRSPLLNAALPADDLRSRVNQIRSGFKAQANRC